MRKENVWTILDTIRTEVVHRISFTVSEVMCCLFYYFRVLKSIFYPKISSFKRIYSQISRQMSFWPFFRFCCITAIFCDILRNITTYYDILWHITTYYDIYDILRHITTYYDILRHITTYYDKLHVLLLKSIFYQKYAHFSVFIYKYVTAYVEEQVLLLKAFELYPKGNLMWMQSTCILCLYPY